jgi:hypothetical protein
MGLAPAASGVRSPLRSWSQTEPVTVGRARSRACGRSTVRAAAGGKLGLLTRSVTRPRNRGPQAHRGDRRSASGLSVAAMSSTPRSRSPAVLGSPGSRSAMRWRGAAAPDRRRPRPASPASMTARASWSRRQQSRNARRWHGLPTVPRPRSTRPVLAGRPDAASTNAVAPPSPLSLLETDTTGHATWAAATSTLNSGYASESAAPRRLAQCACGSCFAQGAAPPPPANALLLLARADVLGQLPQRRRTRSQVAWSRPTGC